MPLKILLLHLNLDSFCENLDDKSVEQGEWLHQDLAHIGAQGLCAEGMIRAYCSPL